LQQSYEEAGSQLLLLQGDSQQRLLELCQKHQLSEVCWIERSAPHVRRRDEKLRRTLQQAGVKVTVTPGSYLADPAQILNASGAPYVVFTPFSKFVLKHRAWGKPLPAPSIPKALKLESINIDSLRLLPKISWDEKITQTWQPGRKAAMARLGHFCESALSAYGKGRDMLDHEGTSRLSPHIAFGELSPREIWEACEGIPKAEPYLRQLLWREFGHHFLHHFPQTPAVSWRQAFEAFPWRDDPSGLDAWQKGRTGYPIVDAGMRQLWTTGWMHNRVRMIVASFLIKDLRIHWREGARWFWDTLLDADLGNNSLGWQWVAGSGPDAAPYFRIFNPVLQGKKFDPDGSYVRRFVPELADVETKYIHSPWEAPPLFLRQAGVTLGVNYPDPIVDHALARDAALAGYEHVKRMSS
jgi:deoxyribodipyrimidine photo-lyase